MSYPEVTCVISLGLIQLPLISHRGVPKPSELIPSMITASNGSDSSLWGLCPRHLPLISSVRENVLDIRQVHSKNQTAGMLPVDCPVPRRKPQDHRQSPGAGRPTKSSGIPQVAESRNQARTPAASLQRRAQYLLLLSF